jgi:GntR family transcriptional regulator, rspAB operon transcriptional repressor
MSIVKFSIQDKGSLAAQVTSQLRDAIVRLELPPGVSLSETDVARRFGVSRQPVREAFIKLADMGLLAIRPQRGTFVRQISTASVMNARFVREAVEVAVVREAALTPRPNLQARLGKLLEGQAERAAANDAFGFLRLDEAFHEALAGGIGRPTAWSILEDLKAQMDRVRYLSFESATPLVDLVDQHRAIVDRIGAGDAAGAEAAMRRHLREILSSLPLIASAHPDYFTKDEPSEVSADQPRIRSNPDATQQDTVADRRQTPVTGLATGAVIASAVIGHPARA